MNNPISLFPLSLFPQFPMDIHYKDDSEYAFSYWKLRSLYISAAYVKKFIFAMYEILFFKD